MCCEMREMLAIIKPNLHKTLVLMKPVEQKASKHLSLGKAEHDCKRKAGWHLVTTTVYKGNKQAQRRGREKQKLSLSSPE